MTVTVLLRSFYLYSLRNFELNLSRPVYWRFSCNLILIFSLSWLYLPSSCWFTLLAFHNLNFNLFLFFLKAILLTLFLTFLSIHFLIVMSEQLFVSSVVLLFLSHSLIYLIHFLQHLKHILIFYSLLFCHLIVFLWFVVWKMNDLSSYVLTAFLKVSLWYTFFLKVRAKSLIFFLIEGTKDLSHSRRFYLSHKSCTILGSQQLSHSS